MAHRIVSRKVLPRRTYIIYFFVRRRWLSRKRKRNRKQKHKLYTAARWYHIQRRGRERAIATFSTPFLHGEGRIQPRATLGAFFYSDTAYRIAQSSLHAVSE